MGIGLKLAKRFIEGINGSISLDDTETNGAAFIIIIPELNKSTKEEI
jgi:sensor histidine kinase regulating citrate/malate metabolism